MAFEWPLNKLGIINSALTLTGDNTVNVADDGSDEWTVGSVAYERAMAYMIDNGSWGFATLVATLQPSSTPPQDVAWDTAYPIPTDCIHIIWIKLANIQNVSPSTGQTPSLTLWDINATPTGPVIVVNAQGGPPPPSPPLTPASLTMKYISNSGALTDTSSGATPTFIVALQEFVRSGIFAGYHEDYVQADKTFAGAKMLLQEARARYDQQKPKRQFFNSRITAARRIRRPWPPTGNDSWGGSGIPG